MGNIDNPKMGRDRFFQPRIFPAMGNKLKLFREKARMTHEQAGEAMGVSRSQYIKLERNERRLNLDYIERAASAFGVSPADIISDDPPPSNVPLVGYVGAGAEVQPEFEQVPPEGLEQIHIPFALPAEMIAFQIRGDSMLPVYRDGMVLVVYREQRRPGEWFFGKEAVVRTEDGRRFVKTIMRGNPTTLYSTNAPPIENAVPVWLGEIFAILPRESLGNGG
ncbi:MAG: XRE family transcriptional regulator [Martelella sp.]|uniref:XRE family transcriptional regulator n=1 Tax=unclassified Martelella TaxID=2629616 RepID=UPI000C65A6F0|nr:XRE family transcriptional regulator [Martelella sp.]MAU19194.1 XRE family transcriptional regulator [Martelella sp.]|tara:strand:- start:2894 stop:3556 length:663 start_codon:yes stop_codon:yes gene_type:complete